MLTIVDARGTGWNDVAPLLAAKHQQMAASRGAQIASTQDVQRQLNAKDAEPAHRPPPPSDSKQPEGKAPPPPGHENGLGQHGHTNLAAALMQEAEAEAANAAPKEGELTEEQQTQVQQLKARDREVRNHEQAHAAVGGAYAGSPSYTFQSGPDGQRYAIGGEVPIDIAPIEGDPEATIEKMQTVKAAALAPAEPSSQDRKVASIAETQRAQALADLTMLRQEQRSTQSYSRSL